MRDRRVTLEGDIALRLAMAAIRGARTPSDRRAALELLAVVKSRCPQTWARHNQAAESALYEKENNGY